MAVTAPVSGNGQATITVKAENRCAGQATASFTTFLGAPLRPVTRPGTAYATDISVGALQEIQIVSAIGSQDIEWTVLQGEALIEIFHQSNSIFRFQAYSVGYLDVQVCGKNTCTPTANPGSCDIVRFNIVCCGQPFSAFSITPNPAEDEAEIIFEQDTSKAPTEVRIMDAYGNLKKEISPKSEKLKISVKGWQSGVYYVHVRRSGREGWKRLMVK